MSLSKKARVLHGLQMVAVATLMATAEFALAQDSSIPKPLSTVGGYTGQAIKQLYDSDIGTGYTAQSLNSYALRSAQTQAPYVGQSSFIPGGASASIGPGAGSRSSKPFSSVSTTPTVSPYLNLFNTSRTGSDAFNYQTLVRPQLQQQAINQQQQRENLDIDRKVQALAARSAYNNPAGSDTQAPTGHETGFMYYGHYYQNGGPHRKRQ